MKVMDAYGIWLYNYTEGACESNPNKGPLVCSSEPRLCQKGVSVVIDSHWKKAHPHRELVINIAIVCDYLLITLYFARERFAPSSKW